MASDRQIIGGGDALLSQAKTPRYMCIANDLRSKIVTDELRPGTAIPSHTVLMREYGVALGTIRQVMQELRSEGLVRSRRGKGVFVIDAEMRREKTPAARIGLAYVGAPAGHASIPRKAMLAAQRVFSRQKMDMVVLGVESAQQSDELLAWADGFSGVMLFDGVTESLVRKLQETGKAVVVVGEMKEGSCPPGAAQVTADALGTIDMALSFAMSLGHRRICLIYYKTHQYGAELYEEFQRLTEQRGLAKEVSKVGMLSSFVDIEREPQIASLLAELRPAPTVLVVSGGMRACRLIRHLERASKRVPEDLSVVAINERPVRDLAIPELSRVDLDNVKMLEGSAEALLELMASGHVARRHISPRLYWGRTCLPIEADQRESPSDGKGAVLMKGV